MFLTFIYMHEVFCEKQARIITLKFNKTVKHTHLSISPYALNKIN